MNPAPRISVVIPVHNCKETIGKCLDSLSQLDHSDFEVIVVDDGSTDETAEICESFPRVKVIRVHKNGPSTARNIGIEAARGEFVAFTDGDCLVDKRWLEELETGFSSPVIAGVGGDQKSPDDDTVVGKRIQRFLKTIGFVTGYIKTDAAMKETEHNPSCNAMYRKSVLEDVGGFDEALWPGEDVELDLKITTRGHTLIYNPNAVVYHYRPKTYSDFGRMMLRYGACQWYLVAKYGFFRRIQYVPLLTLLGFGFVIAALAWEPGIWPIVLLPWPLLFCWFYVKTRNYKTTLQFVYLMLITLINWHWGFFTGWARFSVRRTAKS
jgi:glycosyltransferase involved in cell wall biosynthesis